jgi:predicted acyltransferase
VYDPEGILSTIPAICNALMGAFTARFLLKNPLKLDSNRLLGAMFFIGGGLIVVAELWALIFPINKIVWTSSFVLITGGISIWFLTFFYWFVDVMGFKKVVQPFIWIGTNSITIYLAVHNIINFESTAHYFLDGMLQNSTIDAQNFGIASGVLCLQIAGLYFYIEINYS